MEFLPLANGMDSHTQHKNSPSRGPTVAEAGVPPPESQGGYPKLRCWPQALVYSQVPVGDKPRRSLNRGGLYGAFMQIEDVWQPCVQQPSCCRCSNSFCSLCPCVALWHLRPNFKTSGAFVNGDL